MTDSVKDVSIIFPFYRGFKFAKLGLESMVRNNTYKYPLLVGIEPGAPPEDLAWLETIPKVWPGEARLYYHEKQLGAYGNPNFLVDKAETSAVIWFTTDQVAGPEWDKYLLRYLRPGRFVTGRLVEAGATLIGDRTMWKRFGVTVDEFDQDQFERFCRSWSPQCELDLPRHYIPMAFHVDDFKDLGMFEAGKDSSAIRTYRADLYFFIQLLEKGYELVEDQRALTYHFQSGSKRAGMTPGGYLNWVYPFGLYWLHKLVTGYEPLIKTLESHGARKQLKQVLEKEQLSSP